MPVLTDGVAYFPVTGVSEEYEAVTARVDGEDISMSEAEWFEDGFALAGAGEIIKASGEVVYFDSDPDGLGCTWYVGGEVRRVDYKNGYRR